MELLETVNNTSLKKHPVLPKMRARDLGLRSVSVNPESIARYDCVLVATVHDRFDWEMIQRHTSHRRHSGSLSNGRA